MHERKNDMKHNRINDLKYLKITLHDNNYTGCWQELGLAVQNYFFPKMSQ